MTSPAAGLALAGERLERAYAWLEAALAGRTWAAGEDFTLADCAAVPSAVSARGTGSGLKALHSRGSLFAGAGLNEQGLDILESALPGVPQRRDGFAVGQVHIGAGVQQQANDRRMRRPAVAQDDGLQ